MLKATFPLIVVTAILAANSNGSDIQRNLDQGDYETVRIQIESALTQAPDNPAVLLQKVRLELAENKLDQAANDIEQVLAIDNTHPDVHTLAGQVYGMRASRAGIFTAGALAKKSLAAYEHALTLSPTNVEALNGMIEFRLSAPRLHGGNVDLALEYAERLRKFDPVSGGLKIASIYQAKNKTEQQFSTLDALTTSNPADPRPWLQLGFAHQAKRDYGLAHTAFSASIQHAEKHAEHFATAQAARYQVGRTAVFAKSNIVEGIAALSDYIEQPIEAALPEKPWALYRRGLLLELAGDSSAAQRDFEAAKSTNDRDLRQLLKRR